MKRTTLQCSYWLTAIARNLLLSGKSKRTSNRSLELSVTQLGAWPSATLSETLEHVAIALNVRPFGRPLKGAACGSRTALTPVPLPCS